MEKVSLSGFSGPDCGHGLSGVWLRPNLNQNFDFRPKWQSSWLQKKNSCISKFIITPNVLKILMIHCPNQMRLFPVSGETYHLILICRAPRTPCAYHVLIDDFSAEMQKLQKINTRLEKNAEDWKIKHYNCQQQPILLTESNLKQTEKNQKLEKLCRALQVKYGLYYMGHMSSTWNARS